MERCMAPAAMSNGTKYACGISGAAPGLQARGVGHRERLQASGAVASDAVQRLGGHRTLAYYKYGTIVEATLCDTVLRGPHQSAGQIAQSGRIRSKVQSCQVVPQCDTIIKILLQGETVQHNQLSYNRASCPSTATGEHPAEGNGWATVSIHHSL